MPTRASTTADAFRLLLSQRGAGITSCPPSRPSSTLALISTSDIQGSLPMTGTRCMQPNCVAVAPTSTYLPRNVPGGIEPLSTSMYETRGKCPDGPENGTISRCERHQPIPGPEGGACGSASLPGLPGTCEEKRAGSPTRSMARPR
jgi:hypothetical protein